MCSIERNNRLQGLPPGSSLAFGSGNSDITVTARVKKAEANTAMATKNNFYCAVAVGAVAAGGATAVVGSYVAVIGYIPLPQAKALGLAGPLARFVGGVTALAGAAYLNANCRR
jgi:hypothetical protein